MNFSNNINQSLTDTKDMGVLEQDHEKSAYKWIDSLPIATVLFKVKNSVPEVLHSNKNFSFISDSFDGLDSNKIPNLPNMISNI